MSENEATDKPIADTIKEPEKVNPAPEHVPSPVQEVPHHEHDLIGELKERLTQLESQVAELTSTGTEERDTTPAKQPWTHRRLF